MKIYSKKFEEQFMKHIKNVEDVYMVKIKKNKDSYDIMVTINSLDVILYDIRDCIEYVNETYYESKINVGKMLIEI